MSRGQSLVELAVCAPLVVLLTLGTAAAVQVIDASAGLQAATQAAAAEASRAPDAASGESAASARFQSMVADYPLRSPHLSITVGQFSRTDEAVATASGTVDISWAGMVFPRQLMLNSRAVIPLESWRSHRPAS
ncbi:MAG TPA: TadE/TadG family type IV pilus assembly protein [Candidatus Dormibacteraeota bacterium]